MKKLLILLCLLPLFSEAKIHRSQSARVAFVRANACPATGLNKLPCKGYIIDHVKALACGGADAPSNMQWQTVAEAKAKDKWELKACGK
jgi:hypothetical protein